MDKTAVGNGVEGADLEQSAEKHAVEARVDPYGGVDGGGEGALGVHAGGEARGCGHDKYILGIWKTEKQRWTRRTSEQPVAEVEKTTNLRTTMGVTS